ncbi:MAG: DUF4203 domain-containing protein [Candidatus Promineifilaceae bacterium]|nr:DUF4203 domain-containing protein [Candidatus Promineifilaceae bacterium]
MLVEFLLSILFLVVGLILGFYLLLWGRRGLAVTTGIICLSETGSLLALIFLGENVAWALTEEPSWALIGITLVAGVIGTLLGARNKRIATVVLGFAAGGYIALWFYDIAYHLVVNLGNWSEQVAFWVGVAILIVGGLIGLFLTRRSEAVALILISVFVGTDILVRALNLSSTSSWTAVISISIALLGLVVQYAQYLREIKGEMHHFYAEAGTPAPEFFDLSSDK